MAADDFFLQVQGAVPLGEMNVPTQLLGGGHVSVEETDHRRSMYVYMEMATRTIVHFLVNFFISKSLSRT